MGWLQKEIEKRGWTQADLADKAGIGGSVVSLILNGTRTMGPDSARAIAGALQIQKRRYSGRRGSYHLQRNILKILIRLFCYSKI